MAQEVYLAVGMPALGVYWLVPLLYGVATFVLTTLSLWLIPKLLRSAGVSKDDIARWALAPMPLI